MQNTNLTRFVVLFVAVGVAVSMAGPAFAALTYDNETVNSASVSDLTGGEVVTDLENESKFKHIQVISDNASTSTLANEEEAFTLEATVNDTNNRDDGYTYTIDDSSAWTVVNASAGHYMLNLSHAEIFSQLPRGVNEDVTVELTTTFNKTEADEESATITITASNGETRAVDVITDENVANSNDVETINESDGFGKDLDYAEIQSENEITENTTVTYVLANETVANKYTNAYDVESFESGDYVYSMTAYAEGRPIQVFDSKAGGDREPGWFTGGFNSSDDTHAVYHHNGGDHFSDQRLDIEPRGADANETYLQTSSEGNKKLGFWTTYRHFGSDAAWNAGAGEVPG